MAMPLKMGEQKNKKETKPNVGMLFGDCDCWFLLFFAQFWMGVFFKMIKLYDRENIPKHVLQNVSHLGVQK